MRFAFGLSLIVLLAFLESERRAGFGPYGSTSVAHAAAGDDQFDTVAGANGRVWKGSAADLGTDGGPLPAQVSAVFQWSNPAQAFTFWFRGFPANFNTLTAVATHGYYFFQAPQGVQFLIPGSAGYVRQPTQPSFETVAGATGTLWLGSPVAPDSLPGGISAVFRWDNQAQSFDFWFRGFPANFNTLSPFLATDEYYFFQSVAPVVVTVPAPSDPGTSAALIDEALANGTLQPLAGTTAPETALIYKIYAEFGDPLLPAELQGTVPPGPEFDAVEDAVETFGALSEDARALVHPFLLPPAATGSWYDQATNATGGTRAGFWENTSNDFFKVWWRSEYPEDEAAANDLLTQIDTVIWPALSNVLGAGFGPISDSGLEDEVPLGDGGDGKLDFYIFPIATHSFVQGYTGYPCPEGRPSFIVLKRSGTSALRRDAANTLMATMLKARFTCASQYDWLRRATGIWAENLVYPSANSEHSLLPAFFADMRIGLPIDSVSLNHEYGAYLWLYYLTQIENDPGLVRTIFVQAPLDLQLAVHEVIRDSIAGTLSQRWHDFSLATLNVGSAHQFSTWDGVAHSSLPAAEVMDADQQIFSPVTLPPLGFNTKLVHLDPSAPAGTDVRLLHPIFSPLPTIRWQVMLKRNGAWQAPETLTVDTKDYCADSAADRIEAVAMVVSNGATVGGEVAGEFEVETGEFCCPGSPLRADQCPVPGEITGTFDYEKWETFSTTMLRYTYHITATFALRDGDIPGVGGDTYDSVTGTLQWTVERTAPPGGSCVFPPSASGSVQLATFEEQDTKASAWIELPGFGGTTYQAVAFAPDIDPPGLTGTCDSDIVTIPIGPAVFEMPNTALPSTPATLTGNTSSGNAANGLSRAWQIVVPFALP